MQEIPKKMMVVYIDKILAIKILMKWNELANNEYEVKGPWPKDGRIFEDAARVIEMSNGSMRDVGHHLYTKNQDTLQVRLGRHQTKTGTPQDFKVGRHAFTYRQMGGKVYDVFRTSGDGESSERLWIAHTKSDAEKKMKSLREQYPLDKISMLVRIQGPYRHVKASKVKNGRDAAIGACEVNEVRQNKVPEQQLEM